MVGDAAQGWLVETTILTDVDTSFDVVTDGTSFFVGAARRVVRIAPDGTSSVAVGFPSAPDAWQVDVSWHGTLGWYVVDLGYRVLAARVDANGDAIETASNTLVGETLDVAADGDRLLMLRARPQLDLAWLDQSTLMVSQGASIGVVGNAQPLGRLERLGSQIVVAWNAPSLQLKFVDP